MRNNIDPRVLGIMALLLGIMFSLGVLYNV